MRSLGLLLCLAALQSTALAACQTGLAERLHAKLNLQRPLLHELTVCEPWRVHLGRSIVVLTMPGRAPDTLDLEVLVVQQPDNGNSERAVVLAQARQSVPTAGDDGLAVADIELDAARYRLSSDLRSFGLRITRRSAAMQQPASSETLSLFALAPHNRLELLLDELETRRERGQWSAGCAGRFEKHESQVAVSHATASRGLADLRVSRTDWRSVNELQGEDCVESSERPRYSEGRLRFDGSQYRSAD